MKAIVAEHTWCYLRCITEVCFMISMDALRPERKLMFIMQLNLIVKNLQIDMGKETAGLDMYLLTSEYSKGVASVSQINNILGVCDHNGKQNFESIKCSEFLTPPHKVEEFPS
ncbi:hypothetical protein VNO77_20928 [Canavalia gladiata]|uniref:Uncharacterized protein n=1 Tax=Canavalia gladiata TaxID=3824 RepID=A0AAN9LQ55_CANGL